MRGGLDGQKRSQLLKETGKCRLAFQDQMILTLQRDEAGARDARGHPPACFEGDSGVLPRVHDKRRHFDL